MGIKTDPKRVARYVRAYARAVEGCTAADIESAAQWYGDAHSVALQIVAMRPEWDIERASAIIAAFSPRCRWSTNVAHAIQYASGMRPRCLGNNLRMADAAAREGYAALKGAKTNAFARNIAGDSSAVTIDVWMMRAAGMETDSPNLTQYAELAMAVERVAARMRVDNSTAQALIWIRFRGSAD